jgi:hypothetical protein
MCLTNEAALKGHRYNAGNGMNIVVANAVLCLGSIHATIINSVFSVEVTSSRMVGFLKEALKDKVKHSFSDLDAKSIQIVTPPPLPDNLACRCPGGQWEGALLSYILFVSYFSLSRIELQHNPDQHSPDQNDT